LNYTASVRDAAARGKLQAVTNLYPSELVEEVLDFEKDVGDMGSQSVEINGEAQVAGKESGASLQKVNTVSFVGGDHGYEFSETSGTETTTENSAGFAWESFVGLGGELTVTVAGIGMAMLLHRALLAHSLRLGKSVSFSVRANIGSSIAIGSATATAEESTTGFVMKDSNFGDKYVTSIYR